MKIAIEGCCHGELDAIYRHIEALETKNQYKVDVLLICGDFQAIRNHQDLQCMAVPPKYRQLGEFHKYYTGEKLAPILTIVIGGNHEASNYLWELYHGGWLAPNIYFLGHAGCVQVNGIRIAGASGIFKPHDFRQGHWEKVPYDHGAMRSIYHIREYNVRRLSLLTPPQIFLSHDWPQSIEHHGDLPGLMRRKPFFREDINSGKLGSPPLMGLLRTLKPEWWFSAHLHVRFEATMVHGPVQGLEGEEKAEARGAKGQNPDEILIDDEDDEMNGDAAALETEENVSLNSKPPPIPPTNPDEITLDDEEEDVAVPPVPPPITRFLALDKCLPRRDFLEVIDIPLPSPSPGAHEVENSEKNERTFPSLTFDSEWLAITRAFHPHLSTTRHQPPFPDEAEARDKVRNELEWITKNISSSAERLMNIDECQKFAQTAPGPGGEGKNKFQQPPWYTNPQTVSFCAMLGIENKINPPPPGHHHPSSSPPVGGVRASARDGANEEVRSDGGVEEAVH